MGELELLETAISIAVDAHKGRKDRYGAPFILHPLRVMARMETSQERTVAVLHDIVEKTAWTVDKLHQVGFPVEITEPLQCLTKKSGETYDSLIQRAASNPVARQVKIADLEDNMDPRRMRRIGEEDRERLQKYLKAWLELKRL